jgi:hypothetical protein
VCSVVSVVSVVPMMAVMTVVAMTAVVRGRGGGPGPRGRRHRAVLGSLFPGIFNLLPTLGPLDSLVDPLGLVVNGVLHTPGSFAYGVLSERGAGKHEKGKNK